MVVFAGTGPTVAADRTVSDRGGGGAGGWGVCERLSEGGGGGGPMVWSCVKGFLIGNPAS